MNGRIPGYAVTYDAQDCFGFAGKYEYGVTCFQGESPGWVGRYYQQAISPVYGETSGYLYITSAENGRLSGYDDHGLEVTGTYRDNGTFSLAVPGWGITYAGTYGRGWVGTWTDTSNVRGVFINHDLQTFTPQFGRGTLVYDAYLNDATYQDGTFVVDTLTDGQFTGTVNEIWSVTSGTYSNAEVQFDLHTDAYGGVDIHYDATECFGFAGAWRTYDARPAGLNESGPAVCYYRSAGQRARRPTGRAGKGMVPAGI